MKVCKRCLLERIDQEFSMLPKGRRDNTCKPCRKKLSYEKKHKIALRSARYSVIHSSF